MTKSSSNTNHSISDINADNNKDNNNALNRKIVRCVDAVGAHGMRVTFPGVSSQPTMDTPWNRRIHQALTVKHIPLLFCPVLGLMYSLTEEN